MGKRGRKLFAGSCLGGALGFLIAGFIAYLLIVERFPLPEGRTPTGGVWVWVVLPMLMFRAAIILVLGGAAGVIGAVIGSFIGAAIPVISGVVKPDQQKDTPYDDETFDT